MSTLTFGMNVSLDGYVAAAGDDLGWSVPSDELLAWWSNRVAQTDLALYGRRMWDAMSSHWPTAHRQPGVTPAELEYTRRWGAMPKVVFSSTARSVDCNARLVTGDAVREIAQLKAEGDGTMDVCGAHARRRGRAGRAGRRVRAGPPRRSSSAAARRSSRRWTPGST